MYVASLGYSRINPSIIKAYYNYHVHVQYMYLDEKSKYKLSRPTCMGE